MKNPRQRREAEKEQFKETVLDTAVKLMKKENNWYAVSINKIAAQMGYTPPNIYHYFKNKEDIKFHLGVRGSLVIKEKLKKIELKTYQNPVDKLFDIAVQYREFAFENQELYDIMFHTRQERIKQDLVWENIKVVMKAVKEVDTSIDTEDDNYKAYQTFFCLIHGFISIKFNKRIPVNEKYFNEMFENALKKYILEM